MHLPLARGLLALAAGLPLAAAEPATVLPLAPVVGAEMEGGQPLSFRSGKAVLRFAGREIPVALDEGGKLLRFSLPGEARERLVAAQGRIVLPLALPGGRAAEATLQVAFVGPSFAYLADLTRLRGGDERLGLALLDSDCDGVFGGAEDRLQVRSAGRWSKPLPSSPVVSAGERLWQVVVAPDLASAGLTPWVGDAASLSLRPGPAAAGRPAPERCQLRLASEDGRLVLDAEPGVAVAVIPGAYRVEQAMLQLGGDRTLLGAAGRIALKPGANQLVLAVPERLDVAAGVFQDGALLQLDDPALVDANGIRYRASLEGATLTARLRLGAEERAVVKLEYG